MMVTPLETMELLNYLKAQNLWNEELKTKLDETVKKFRLDQTLGSGKKSFLRRTYTCTFFNHQELGCPLPFDVKPFGCLAFNSHHSTLKASEHCYSDIPLLERREALHPEEKHQNEELQKQFKLHWEKLPLPLALLELASKD